MNRVLQIACACGFALALATGCRPDRTREFAAVQHPMTFENWRIYVNARVDGANPSPTNHFYVISAVAWKALGDSIDADPGQFRPTTYDASLDSLRLFLIEGANTSELQLPPLRHGPADQPNRLVQLFHANGTGVEIPASVSELRAQGNLVTGGKSGAGRKAENHLPQRAAEFNGATLTATEDADRLCACVPRWRSALNSCRVRQ